MRSTVPRAGSGSAAVATARRVRADLRRRAVGLLDQQLWCWGRDVVRPEGNVLLAFGMCRHRPAGSKAAGTAYSGPAPGGGVVWLWGFGLVYARPDVGAVFLRRYGFDPLLIDGRPVRPVHRLEDLGPLVRPATSGRRAAAGALVRLAAEWVAGYEHRVAEAFGPAYRQAALAARDKSPVVPARDMAGAWEHLARKSARLAAPQAPLVGARRTLLAALVPARAPARGSGPYGNRRGTA